MTAHRPRRKKQSVLIEPFKQIKFGLYVLGISTAFLFASGFLFVRAFRDQYEHVMGLFNVVDESMQWELVTNDVFTANAIRIGVLYAVYLAVLFGVIFRLTHRYYGPLVSIERFVEEIKRGNYAQRVRIRRGDELHGLVNSLNAMAEHLEKRHGKNSRETRESKHPN
ncbi:MAG: hypothetical protein RIQ81_371 [Pseudomonadota bacterium]